MQFQGGPERLSKTATVLAETFALCVYVSPFLFLLLRFPLARDLFEERRGRGRGARARDVTSIDVCRLLALVLEITPESLVSSERWCGSSTRCACCSSAE